MPAVGIQVDKSVKETVWLHPMLKLKLAAATTITGLESETGQLLISTPLRVDM